MSRLKRFAHSLLSGYLLLGVNALFTFASVILALRYLGKPEFGLWVLTSQLSGLVAFLDFGLSSAAGRILIDYQDHQKPGEYGGTIQTDVLVGLAQSGLVLLIGLALAFVVGPLMDIPADLQRTLFWLILGQCAISAFNFATRIVGHILIAQQRFDIWNYSNAFGFGLNYVLLWWGFMHGFGVFSMLMGQAGSVILVLILNVAGCHRLQLFPQRGQWGRPTWEKFHELFAFGRDSFLLAVGYQFINASQTLLLVRLVGLNAAAVWSVGTRVYLLLVQVLSRILAYSSSALAEMIVRDERDRLLQRFRQIATLSVNLAVAAGTILAVCNGPFVAVWTSGKIQWATRAT